MPSLRAICLFATTAFAAIASAVPLASSPLPGTGLDGATNSVGQVGQVASGSGLSNLVMGGTNTVTPGAGGVSSRDEVQSLPVILAALQVQVTTFTDKCHDAIGGSTLDIDVATNLIGEIKAIVDNTVLGVQAIVSADVGVVFGLQGKVLVLADVCTLLATVLALLFGALDLILCAVAQVKADICLQVLVGVSTSICNLIQAIVVVVVRLNVGDVIVVLAPLVNKCYGVLAHLQFTAVIQLLGITN